MASHLSRASEQHFRRQSYRLVIPWLFACGEFGLFTVRVPDGIWYAVPALTICLLMCLLLHGGIRLTRAGIEWYVLTPGWYYRRVPWGVVRKVQVDRPLQPTVLLTVEAGRYEPWVFGATRRDRPSQISIRTNGYTRGDEPGGAIDYCATASLAPRADDRNPESLASHHCPVSVRRGILSAPTLTPEVVVSQRIHVNSFSEHAVFLILFASSAGGL